MGIPIIGDIIDGVKDIISEVVVDKDKRDQINFELKQLADKADERAHEEILAQIEVNKTEATSGSVFVAGWRPFVGWVSGVGLGMQAILLPFLAWVTTRPMPMFDTELLILTLGGMLGIGGMRTYEKVKGVSTNDYRDRPVAKEKPQRLVDNSLPDEAPWVK